MRPGLPLDCSGESDLSGRFLHGLTDSRVAGRAARLIPLIGRLDSFRSAVNETVAEERARLKLAALEQAAF